eukprot:CAMPEP_0177621100 /NCGR_PEP_ID=MMETSP0419_2-20121207/27371_1 /TAXON_ID=582737 /ORGANISM="Tetraselmis sp., Strain GSL018" /LENGTH=604 /DNA_ID=CAMNT_0019120927 /DNA_START=486 /DNA_END=2300 /DNA_ORIENTATION=-
MCLTTVLCVVPDHVLLQLTQISKAGFLWKRSSMLRRWLRRWYVVKEGMITYSYSPQDAALYNCEKALDAAVHFASKATSKPLKRTTPEGDLQDMFGLVVKDRNGKSVELYTPSCNELEEWVEVLSKASSSAQFVTNLYDLNMDNPLGCGAFATVVKGKRVADGQVYAVKIISRSAFLECADMLNKEINILHMVGKHRNVVTLKEVLHAPSRVYMVFDFCDGGELVDRVTTACPMSERAAAGIIRQLCEALAHLHDQGVAHMDIKPENIVFTSREKDSPIKLIDFSLATFFHAPTEPGGTPEFVAPEIVRDPDGIAKSGVGGEVDMWAVGVMLYFLLSGKTPFDDKSVTRVLENVMQGYWQWRGRRWSVISDRAKHLVRMLLQPKPMLRLTARQVLEHDWILSRDQLPDRPAAVPARGSPQREPVVERPHGVAGFGDRADPGSASGSSNGSPPQPGKNFSCDGNSTPVRFQMKLPGICTSWARPSEDGTEASSRLRAVGSFSRKSPGETDVHQPMTPSAFEVLSSISNTRQNMGSSPRHSPKVGLAELQKFRTRQKVRNAILEAAKTPEKIAALATSQANSFSENGDLRRQLFTKPSSLRPLDPN